MHDDPLIVALVARAVGGDQSAWNEIVERYAPLVWSICRRYQLDRQDVDDVGQSVWLLLIENLEGIQQPAALPGWLATTTQRECLRTLRAARRHDHAELPAEDQMQSGSPDAMIEQEILLAERNAALRAAFAELPRGCRQLLALLLADPPRAYAEVSATMDMPVGSIGPTRLRCLKRLRRSRHLTAIADSRAWDVEAKQTRGERGD